MVLSALLIGWSRVVAGWVPGVAYFLSPHRSADNFQSDNHHYQCRGRQDPAKGELFPGAPDGCFDRVEAEAIAENPGEGRQCDPGYENRDQDGLDDADDDSDRLHGDTSPPGAGWENCICSVGSNEGDCEPPPKLSQRK